MSIISDSAFDESEAVKLLSRVLESKRSIKTFFGENDRTPNHDGFFELVSGDQTPKKQFIVQIKKVENLEPNSQGKYNFQLKTNFLYYVKEKVTESPAIYFVVDIKTERIFWLYLSDEKLMQLDFENHKTISYSFCEEEIIIDIDSFTRQLDIIATKRNRLFLKKTPQEIAEMQEAADYINRSLDYELPFIKEAMFPRLWRFGIKHSNTTDLSIIVREKETKMPFSSLYALYPQQKGEVDTGVREYYQDNTDFYRQIHFGKEKNPLEYCVDTLQNIVKAFFEGMIPLKYLPDIAVKEIIGLFYDESQPLFAEEKQDGKIDVNETERRFCLLANYTYYLLTHEGNNSSEKQIKRQLQRMIFEGYSRFQLASGVLSSGGKSSFREFCSNNPNLKNVFNPVVFKVITAENIRFYLAIHELKERHIMDFSPIWTYDPIRLRMKQTDEFNEEVNDILDYWLNNLPALYEETYLRMISNNKYHFSGKFVYSNVGERYDERLARVKSIVQYYQCPNLLIIKDDSIRDTFEEYFKREMPPGLESLSQGILFDDFLDGKALFYQGINCLLYNGVCYGFGFKPQQLSFKDSRMMRDISLFDTRF